MFQEYWKSDKPSLLILGAGGLGEEVAEIAQLTGEFDSIAFLDDSKRDSATILGRTQKPTNSLDNLLMRSVPLETMRRGFECITI